MSNVTKETNGLMTKYSYSEKTLMTCYKRKWIILDKKIMESTQNKWTWSLQWIYVSNMSHMYVVCQAPS
jgi:hypothetical protein